MRQLVQHWRCYRSRNKLQSRTQHRVRLHDVKSTIERISSNSSPPRRKKGPAARKSFTLLTSAFEFCLASSLAEIFFIADLRPNGRTRRSIECRGPIDLPILPGLSAPVQIRTPEFRYAHQSLHDTFSANDFMVPSNGVLETF